MKRVACITFNYLHPNTESAAKSVGADVFQITKEHGSKITALFHIIYLTLTNKKYDIYLIDAAWALFVPLFRRHIFRERIIVIYRSNNPFFNDIWFLQNKNSPEKFIIKTLRKQVDGVIAVSGVTAHDAEKHKKPCFIAYSSVQKLNKFLSIKQNLNTHHFLTMGYAPYKGFDTTVTVFQEIRKEIPDAVLFYMGQYSAAEITKYYKYLNMENVVILGVIRNVSAYLKNISYFIEFPRYEPGPTAVLECMAAGIICFSNDHLGHKDFIKQVSNELIISSDKPKTIAQKILAIIKDKKKIKFYSKKSKLLGKTFGKEYRAKMFKQSFEQLLKKLTPR